MEEEWRVYLRENEPRLYEQMKNSLDHIFAWRYKAGRNDAIKECAKVADDAAYYGTPEQGENCGHKIADTIRNLPEGDE